MEAKFSLLLVLFLNLIGSSGFIFFPFPLKKQLSSKFLHLTESFKVFHEWTNYSKVLLIHWPDVPPGSDRRMAFISPLDSLLSDDKITSEVSFQVSKLIVSL